MMRARCLLIALLMHWTSTGAMALGQEESPPVAAPAGVPAAQSDLAAELRALEDRRYRAFRLADGGKRAALQRSIAKVEEVLTDAKNLFDAPQYADGQDFIISLCHGLSSLYFQAKMFEEAVDRQQQGYDRCRSLYPPEKWPEGIIPTLRCTMRLGRYHLANGNVAEFQKYMLEQESIFLTAPVEESLTLADLKAQFAMGLKRMGKTGLATEFCLSAANMAEKFADDAARSEQALIVQIYWLCSAQLFNVYDVLEAKTYATKAVNLADRLPHNMVYQAKTEALQHLGACHIDLGEYDQAIPRLQQAYDLIKYVDPHNAAGIAINLARAHRLNGQLELAGQWLKRGKDYDVGTQVRLYFQYEEGALHAALGNHDRAWEAYHAALEFQRQHRSGVDRSATVYSALGQLELDRDRPQQAAQWLRRARQLQMAFLQDLLPKASEAAALSYLHFDWRKNTDLYLLATRNLREPDEVRKQYELVSQQRGLIVRALSLRHRLRKELDDEGQAIYRNYLAASNELVSRIDQGQVVEIGSPLKELQTRKDLLERKLAEHMPDLARAIGDLQVSVSDLQDALKDNEVLIDLVRYDSSGDGVYAVFVVTKDAVHRTDLPDAKGLHQQIDAWRKDIAQGHGSRLAGELYGRVWGPFRNHIPASADTLYICGDGALLLLPWSALRGEDDKLLLEHFAIATPPYPQHLLRRTVRRRPEGRLLAVGDVALGDPEPTNEQAKEKSNPHADTAGWPMLDHVAAELKDLHGRARDAGLSVSQLDGDRATPENVLQQLPGAMWAHFATHGFHQPGLRAPGDGRSQPPLPAHRHPLVSTGLILAGTNDLRKEPVAMERRTALLGRLNGATISNLDLSDTELVFLSACDTAVGEVFEGEGVFGLQRAFHTAGAKSVVCSLWQVDDAATALLVQKFYENYWSGKYSALQALREAQLAIYRDPLLLEEFKQEQKATFANARGLKYEPIQRSDSANEQRLPPAFWAGFVYSGVEPDSKP